MLKNLTKIKQEFPIFNQQIGNLPLVYLDNAATAQKPLSVIEAESRYYSLDNANIHRAPHELGERATANYENVREKVRAFINAKSKLEIVFTKGTTDSINLVANSLTASSFISKGSEILVTELEHHSNIVPWQIVASRVSAKVLAAKVRPSGEIDLDDFKNKLGPNTKVVSFAQVSNALGTVHPVEQLVQFARQLAPQALILIDGAQWVAHARIDVQTLDCDFYAFSAHKVYGPTGVGILYGKHEKLLEMPPVNGGGDMIEHVSFSGTTYAKPPYRFEAGTPNIAGVIGLGAALDFFDDLDWKEISAHEQEICNAVVTTLLEIPGVKIIGNPKERVSAVSFTVEGIAPMDVAVKLNQYGIAVRAGHHCCMPLMEVLSIPGTVRASWSIYNNLQDINALKAALNEIVEERVSGPVKEEILVFTPSTAESIEAALGELKKIFSSSGDTRSEILLELGLSHPNRIERLRKLTPQVPGCMSEVRLLTRITEGGRLEIASDSNAQIVRGLLSIVERVFSGQKVSEIKEFGPQNLFTELDLPGFVSMQRRTGLESVLRVLEGVGE